jgi:hypothetical protein
LPEDAMSGRSRSERRKVRYASHMMRSAITIAPAVLATWTLSSLAGSVENREERRMQCLESTEASPERTMSGVTSCR